MLSSLDSRSLRLLDSLQRSAEISSRAQEQISSGKRLHRPSDDPASVPELLALRDRLERLDQHRQNLGRVQSETDTAESALRAAVGSVEKAIAAGAQGASDTQTADGRNVLAAKVQDVLSEVARLSTAQSGGRYVFSGDLDGRSPFEFDTATPTGIGAYQGATTTREVPHPLGGSFAVALSGQAVFDDTAGGRSVFASLAGLRDRLAANDASGTAAALDQLKAASAHLSSALAAYGNYQNAVRGAQEATERLVIDNSERLSVVEDADLPAAALALQSARTHQETALAAHSRFSTRSLFDLLG